MYILSIYISSRCLTSYRLPHEIQESLQHSAGEAPDLIMVVPIKIRRIFSTSERHEPNLGLRDVEQRLDRHLEDFGDFGFLQDVVDALLNHTDERRDEKSAVRDDIVKAANQLHRTALNPDFLLRLANRGRFERFALLHLAAAKCDLTAVRG